MEFPKIKNLRQALCQQAFNDGLCDELHCIDCLLGTDAKANLVLTADIVVTSREYVTFKEAKDELRR